MTALSYPAPTIIRQVQEKLLSRTGHQIIHQTVEGIPRLGPPAEPGGHQPPAKNDPGLGMAGAQKPDHGKGAEGLA
jgi:hypothetical protein